MKLRGRTHSALCALLLLACAFADSACSTTRTVEPEPSTGSSYVSADGSYRLELPQGWKRAGQTLTRDGWEQQTISFNSGRVAQDSAQPIDASAPGFFQALQDELAAQTGVEILDCGPAEIDGASGFRMHFQKASTGSDASRREYLTYGVLADGMLFVFSYEAPAGDGFAHDLAVFERMVKSFQRAPLPPAQTTP